MSEQQNDGVIDEAALDAELEQSIAAVNAGQSLSNTTKTQTETETDTDKDVSENNSGSEVSDENASNSQPAEENGKKEEFRIPNKGKFESDEAYEKRVELFDLVKKRKAATTPEAKQALSNEISRTKGELRTLGENDKALQNVSKPADESIEDPNIVADREKLKAIGGATKEEVLQILREERLQLEIKSDLNKFVEKYPDLKDPDVRDVFFDFVDQNYNWEGKSGKELVTVLEMARENMFRPSESIQDRVLKGANVHEKVSAMQFPGSTGASRNDYSPEMKKSIEELKSTGMSEDKAIELLSD